MSTEDAPRQRVSHQRFLRIVGYLWLIAVLAILIGTLIAPYMGRMADFVLYQTVYRDWVRVTLRTQQPFFDLSSPQSTLKSYYSALYRGDVALMQRLTVEPFRAQVQPRLADTPVASKPSTYHSYLYTETDQAARAAVVEKFHLFWRRGLRFTLQHSHPGWQIVSVDLVSGGVGQ